MFAVSLTVFALFFLVSHASEADVLVLTDDNFDSTVNRFDLILVEFYAPWCGHCKRLQPEYESAAGTLQKNKPIVPLAKVDCTGEGKESCSKYGVSGYPTLKIFRTIDNVKDYDGPRTASGIVQYMKTQARPSSQPLATLEDYETFVKELNEYAVIGYFSPKSNFYKQFMAASNVLRSDFVFAHSFNEDVLKLHKDVVIVTRPKHMHSKLEDNTVELSDVSSSSSAIVQFVKDNFAGLAGHYTPDNSKYFKKPLCVVYYQVDYTLNPKGTNYYRNRVAKVAKKFSDMHFAIASKKDFSPLSDLGINDDATVNPVIYSKEDNKYKMIAEFSVDSLESFVRDYFDDKLEKYLKSEEIPADNDGPVKVVVAKNFDDIVNDANKDVLIEFYAPWCGHCKSLEPKYKELGEKLSDNQNIVIAKMDATANEVPKPYEVRGFPTIYFAPKNRKGSPLKYEGEREVKDFLSYLKQHSTFKDEL